MMCVAPVLVDPPSALLKSSVWGAHYHSLLVVSEMVVCCRTYAQASSLVFSLLFPSLIVPVVALLFLTTISFHAREARTYSRETSKQ